MAHSHTDPITPTGTVNGVNTVFALATTYARVRYFVNGLEQLEDTDYTVAGTVLTVDPPPETGDEHWILGEVA